MSAVSGGSGVFKFTKTKILNNIRKGLCRTTKVQVGSGIRGCPLLVV